MLEELKERVFKANLDLVNKGLVIHTWGNVSGRDFKSGLIVIKAIGCELWINETGRHGSY